jgi:hypothetical protein
MPKLNIISCTSYIITQKKHNSINFNSMNKFFTLFLIFITYLANGQLVINEVLYDPSNSGLDGDANGDGSYDQEDDTFIEIYNNSSTNFDISGYQIWDDTTNAFAKFIFPANTFIPPNGVVVVFGAGPLVGNFGGALTFSNDTSSNGLNFNNSGEVIAIRNAGGNTVLTFDSDALSNNPNESYTRNPDVTGAFEQHGDNFPILFSPGTKVDGTPFDTAYVVESITVSSVSGADSITVNGGSLQMQAIVLPSFATNQSVSWSVAPAAGIASIDANGLLTAAGDGSVVVTATANDASGIMASDTIYIVNQNIGLKEWAEIPVTIFPNPAHEELNVKTKAQVQSISVLNLNGQEVLRAEKTTRIKISALAKGTYLIKVVGKNSSTVTKFVKH